MFRLETWVVTPHIRYMLGGFHHRVARRLLGYFQGRQEDEAWEYPPLGDVMRLAWLEEIETYVSRRQNTVAQYIDTHPIWDLFLEAESRTGSQVPK